MRLWLAWAEWAKERLDHPIVRQFDDQRLALFPTICA
jgi:hypothetical protein